MGKSTLARQVGVGAAHVMRGNPWPYVAPLAGGVLNLALAGFLSLAWGAYDRDATVWQIACRSGLTLGIGAGLLWVTYIAGQARPLVVRAVSMAVALISTAELFVLTFAGFSFDRVVTFTLLMLGGAMALAITRLLAGDGKDTKRGSPFGVLADRVQALAQVGAMSRPKEIDGAVVTDLRMEIGATASELQTDDVRGAIAGAVGVPRGNVMLTEDPSNPSRGRLEILARNLVDKPLPYPGLSAPGGCISEPIRVGTYATGRPVPIHLFGDPDKGRNAIGVMAVLGQQGSGKTGLLLQFIAEVGSRRNADLVVLDTRKAGQLPAWVHKIATVIGVKDAAIAYLDELVEEVRQRTDHLGAEGLSQWTPASTLNAKVIVADEAAGMELTREGPGAVIVDLAESIRSSGIFLVVGLQRATADRFDSSAKQQLGGVICMGVKDNVEAGRVLSAPTMAAGANPEAWGNKKAGCFYAEVPGVAEEDWPRAARTFVAHPKELERAVMGYLTPKAQVTAPVPASQPTTTAAPVTDPVKAPARPKVVKDPTKLDLTDDDPDAPRDNLMLDEGDENEVIDPHEPISATPAGLDLADPPVREYAPEELLGYVRTAVVRLRDKGREAVKVGTVTAMVGDVVGSDVIAPPRMTQFMGALVQEGLLRKADTKGWYKIVQPPTQSD